MRKHSTFSKERGAIWVFGPNWNDFAGLEDEFWCSPATVFSPGIRRASSKLAPTETTGNAPFGIVKVFFPYLPFIGRYGSGSHETQPVKQHSQGGALGMGLLTGPAAVHYSLLVAK